MPTSPPRASKELDEIREALEEVESDVSEARRSAGVGGAIQRSSTLPTEDQRWQVDRAWEVMPDAIDALNVLITSRVPDLNGKLYAQGVRPKPGEAVVVVGR